jgi:outer membrane protein assembly factor BamD (BamD/ComL family)
MRHVTYTRLAVLLLTAASVSLGAKNTQSDLNRNYATDSFDGFEAVGLDRRPKQKEKSFWFSLSEKTPEEQLADARKKEAEGRVRRAQKAYEALIRAWPTSPQAAEAQFNLAHMLETGKHYEKAFDEYQYLLTFYAGHCPYNEVLDRQFRIANHLLHNNRSVFGLALNGMGPIRERFEQIIRNSPRSAIAPEIMLIIGSIRVSERELEEAVSVYDGLRNRFPDTPQAVSAALLAGQCRHELALKNNYNEPRCREAITFFKSVLSRTPDHPQKEQMKAWQNELYALLVEQNYQQALFYDTKQRNAEAAKAAYRRFLTEFADSKHAPQVRGRLEALEKGSPALK